MDWIFSFRIKFVGLKVVFWASSVKNKKCSTTSDNTISNPLERKNRCCFFLSESAHTLPSSSRIGPSLPCSPDLTRHREHSLLLLDSFQCDCLAQGGRSEKYTFTHVASHHCFNIFSKVLKTTHFNAIFVSPIWTIWNANSVEVNMSKNDMFNSMERAFSRKKRAIVHKCDEDDDIRLLMRLSLTEMVTESSRVQCELCSEDCRGD